MTEVSSSQFKPDHSTKQNPHRLEFGRLLDPLQLNSVLPKVGFIAKSQIARIRNANLEFGESANLAGNTADSISMANCGSVVAVALANCRLSADKTHWQETASWVPVSFCSVSSDCAQPPDDQAS
jgi:hypothetical protein